MAGRKSDFTLTKLDDLFSTQEQRDEEKLSKIRDIPLTEIDDFPDHPFKVRDDEDMAQLIESIKERGVITPATVRQKEDGRYELISGHRRKRACELAGFDTLRCEVVELNRDEATILMVESNYHTGKLLESKGYEVRVLDLISMEKSHCYNPFVYLQNDNDVQKLVTNLFKSTTPKGSQSQDPFWDTSASMLLLALVFYLHYEAPEDEQNFAMVMEMLRAGSIEDEEDTRPSPLDELFAELEMSNPDHIALKYYRSYHSGAAKTLKSIQITLAARLEKFNLESLASLTTTDELDLPSLGEKKVALFALIPDNDSSFNFLVSILYTQLFQQLFYAADHIHGGSLPVPVHFLMDEFANVSLPDDFDKILSVMRSRGVSVSIILQNLAQLKALFEKQWESIVGNCDEFLYLGGNEQSTHKYVSELLGKETIDTNTFGKSTGRSGNYSTNYQISGRELLTPDEVRMLDNQYAILFIRGERPVMDFKYDILKHPNVALTTDGKASAYKHGEVTIKHSSISVLSIDPEELPEESYGETNYELLSDEDFEVNKNLF